MVVQNLGEAERGEERVSEGEEGEEGRGEDVASERSEEGGVEGRDEEAVSEGSEGSEGGGGEDMLRDVLLVKTAGEGEEGKTGRRG